MIDPYRLLFPGNQDYAMILHPCKLGNTIEIKVPKSAKSIARLADRGGSCELPILYDSNPPGFPQEGHLNPELFQENRRGKSRAQPKTTNRPISK